MKEPRFVKPRHRKNMFSACFVILVASCTTITFVNAFTLCHRDGRYTTKPRVVQSSYHKRRGTANEQIGGSSLTRHYGGRRIRAQGNNAEESELKKDIKQSSLGQSVRRAFLASSVLAGLQLAWAETNAPTGFERVPTQFIAALGDPKSNSGDAGEFGLWINGDPGPRGVWLDQYPSVLKGHGNVAPSGWTFDPRDWWVEEHGLIMEAPTFPLTPGRYLVTGGRQKTAVLTVGAPKQTTGDDTTSSVSYPKQSWSLDDPDAVLYDVTHLPCRSARYVSSDTTPLPPNEAAMSSDFPVRPGAEMPKMKGYNKQDYAVLFLIGKEKAKKLS